jgi:hypothetical protein
VRAGCCRVVTSVGAAMLGWAPVMGKKNKRTSRKRRKAEAARAKVGQGATQRDGGHEREDSDDDESTDGEEDELESSNADEDPDDSAETDDSDADEEESSEDRTSSAPHRSAAAGGGGTGRTFAPWVQRIVSFERRWSWLESWLLFIALMILMAVLCIWISLNGMSSPLATPNKAGTVFRALFGAVALGGAIRFALRKREMPRWKRSVATAVAAVAGCALAPLWREVGIDFFGGLLDWAQEGSSLTLVGGLRGLGTRLTILVALLGGSLAAATARHINIDVVVRFIRPSLRLPVAVAGGIATATVCFMASYGLLDYMANDGFHAEREATMRQKVSHIGDELGERLFILRKQIGLDLSAVPTVVSGSRWDHEGRMNGRQWNEWIEDGGFRDRYPSEEVDRILAPEEALDQPRHPFVVVPGGSPRGMLVPMMDLTYPFGFFIIGVRVLLRLLLLLLGVVKPFEAGGDDDSETGDEEDDSADAAAQAAEGAS